MMHTLSTLAALTALAPALALAGEPNDPQAAGWYVAPAVSFISADDQRGSGNGKGGLLAIGHHGEVASIEVAALFAAMTKDNARITGGQIALVISPRVDQEFLARLYGVFALGAVEEGNMRGLNYKDGSGLIGDLGIGYRQPVPVQGHLLNLRFDVRYRGDFQMPPRDAGQPAYFHDVVFTAGLQIPMSSPPPPPPAPPLPRVVPPVTDAQPADSTAQPQDSTAQPSAPSAAPAAAESSAPAPPATPPP
jgi:hypothetical protein